jgi:lipoprotein-anchoring transpeptidase ErfK/SrfK
MTGLATGLLAGILLVLTGVSASPGAAAAAEIARPLFWKTGTHISPGGATNGLIMASTRSGEPSGFMVLRQVEIGGIGWLLIRIGRRPNNRVAWVPSEKFLVSQIDSKIIISVRARTMTMFSGGRKAWVSPVVVGKSSTPTPLGLFAVHDFYRVKDDLRPGIIETTAHSEALRTFLGGPARVAIHGRHGQLRVPWGSAVSNGCIRAPDWALRSIRKRAPVGTPIEIRR